MKANQVDNSTKSDPMRARTKLLWFGLSIVVIVGAVFFGWNWTADRLNAALHDKLSELSSNGQTITCNNLDIEGFPFRLGFVVRTQLLMTINDGLDYQQARYEQRHRFINRAKLLPNSMARCSYRIRVTSLK